MNKQFITKNFLLIVMLLSVAFAFAMKATVFQRGSAPVAIPASTTATLPVSTTPVSQTPAKP